MNDSPGNPSKATHLGGAGEGAGAPAPAPDRPAAAAEQELISALRRGEEAAFVELVNRYQSALKRVARIYVSSPAVVEEVVQETWLGVLQGIQRFEGRSSLKTWIFTILANRARTRGERESRSIPFSALVSEEASGNDPAVDADQFRDAADQWPGHWRTPLRKWGSSPESQLLSAEAMSHMQKAIDALPQAQKLVVSLRDVKEWSAEEVCNVLHITETNQRVLLHRGRSKVRRALESYLKERSVK